MKEFTPLSDLQWLLLEPHFPNPVKRGRGKPHTPWRNVVNTVLYIRLTNTKWASAPKGPEWASKSAAHRWMKEWEKSGLLNQILLLLGHEGIAEKTLDHEEPTSSSDIQFEEMIAQSHQPQVAELVL